MAASAIRSSGSSRRVRSRTRTRPRNGVPRREAEKRSPLCEIDPLVPKRVASEEIGDAMELIVKRLKGSEPVWQTYVKLATTIVWILLHSVVYAIKGPSGAKK